MRNVFTAMMMGAMSLFAGTTAAQTVPAASASHIVVIDEIGATIPAAPFYAPLHRDQQHRRARSVPGGPPRAFPIHTPALTLGAINADEQSLHTRLPPQLQTMLSKPLFVIGSDAQSLAWLRERGEWLRSYRATGIVIDVPDGAAWKTVVDTAHPLGLAVLPMPGDVLVKFGLRHYPVVLTREGIRQ